MKKISIFIFVGFLSIVIFELFLRFSPFSYGITPMTYDKDIGMWHKKDFSDYIIKKCYKTKYVFDQTGRIKNNYKYDNKKQDIVLLGDSQIEALMVKNENVIHNSLYQELDGKYNVLNYGLSGTGPSQQLEILKNKTNLNNINRLIHFVFLENDLNDGDPRNFDGTSRPKVHVKFKSLNDYEIIKPKSYDIKERLRDFLGNFEIYVYIKKTYYHYISKMRKGTKLNSNVKQIVGYNNKYELSNEKYKWEQLKGSIYQMNKIAKENEFKYSVVVLSSYEKEGYEKYILEIEQFLHNKNINYINILDFINTLEIKQELKFSCDGHWNDNTHKNLAINLKKEFEL